MTDIETRTFSSRAPKRAWRDVRGLLVVAAVVHAWPSAAYAQRTPADSDSSDVVETAQVPPPLRVEFLAGAGFGTRSFERPTGTGIQRLEATPFTALDAAVRAMAWPEDAFSFGVLLHYQTSVGMRVEAQPLFALPEEVGVRSERVEVSVVPTLRLGDAGAPTLAFPVGATLRVFVPEAHELTVPGYTLFGPHLRVEFGFPFTTAIALRAGPEAQWVGFIADSLRDDGVESSGLALGAQAALEFRLSARFAIDLAYRESHVFAAHVGVGPAFGDVERYAVARIAGTL